MNSPFLYLYIALYRFVSLTSSTMIHYVRHVSLLSRTFRHSPLALFSFFAERHIWNRLKNQNRIQSRLPSRIFRFFVMFIRLLYVHPYRRNVYGNARRSPLSSSHHTSFQIYSQISNIFWSLESESCASIPLNPGVFYRLSTMFVKKPCFCW